jgi:hypothetical protein
MSDMLYEEHLAQTRSAELVLQNGGLWVFHPAENSTTDRIVIELADQSSTKIQPTGARLGGNEARTEDSDSANFTRSQACAYLDAICHQ